MTQPSLSYHTRIRTMNVRDASTPAAIFRAGTRAPDLSSPPLPTKRYRSACSRGTRKTTTSFRTTWALASEWHRQEKQHGYREESYV